MSSRLVFFLFFLILFSVFIGSNLDNRCDVSLVFYTFRNVPVFLSIVFGFAIGVLSAIPVCLFSKRKKDPKKNAGKIKKEKDQKQEQDSAKIQ